MAAEGSGCTCFRTASAWHRHGIALCISNRCPPAPACSEICKAGLTASMTSQVQIEQSLLGWKVSAARCLHNWAAYGATCLPACHQHPTVSCILLPHTDLRSYQI